MEPRSASLNLAAAITPAFALPVVLGIGGGGGWYDDSISHADYLWHPFVAQFDSGAFSAFAGVGALGQGGLRARFYF